MRSVSGLNVPASKAGQRAYRATTRGKAGGQSKSGGTFAATALTEPSSSGRLRVAIDGESKPATLYATAKNVHAGDRVQVANRSGGGWWVIENLSWHQPPESRAPSTTTPRSASTASGARISAPRNPPSTPAYPSGNSNNQLHAWARNVAAFIRYDLDSWASGATSTMEDLRSVLSSTRSATNSNAARQNQARDLAVSTRDSVVGLREGAIQDRIVRE